MRALMTVMILVTLNGCATTIHDYCMNHSEHYSSYGECYNETAQNGQNHSAIGLFFKGFSESYSRNLANSSPKQCTTQMNGNTAYTTCQ